MSKLSERKLIRAAIASKALEQDQALTQAFESKSLTRVAMEPDCCTVANLFGNGNCEIHSQARVVRTNAEILKTSACIDPCSIILAGKTTTEPFRVIYPKELEAGSNVVITANRFCGLCAIELDCFNALECLFTTQKQTTVTYANCCAKCTTKALCSVKKVDRKRILTTISNEIALNFLLELGESFSTSEEFLSTSWFNEFIGDEIARSLRLNDKALLPWICCGRANRKRIRKAAHKEVYQAITRSFGFYVAAESQLTKRYADLYHRVGSSFLLNRLNTRLFMGI